MTLGMLSLAHCNTAIELQGALEGVATRQMLRDAIAASHEVPKYPGGSQLSTVPTTKVEHLEAAMQLCSGNSVYSKTKNKPPVRPTRPTRPCKQWVINTEKTQFVRKTGKRYRILVKVASLVQSYPILSSYLTTKHTDLAFCIVQSSVQITQVGWFLTKQWLQRKQSKWYYDMRNMRAQPMKLDQHMTFSTKAIIRPHVRMWRVTQIKAPWNLWH